MAFSWLYDSSGPNKWHLWNSAVPNLGDAAFCGHTKAVSDTPGGDNSPEPSKCSTCYTSGSLAGLPIT